MPSQNLSYEDYPTNFDSRLTWPGCIVPIENQGSDCGSCWAFSSTSHLSDRFCIKSNNVKKIELSPQDLLQCDTLNKGCDGGFIEDALKHLEQLGASTYSCLPYTSGFGVVPNCTTTCNEILGLPFERYRCSPNSTKEHNGKLDIMRAIITGGPVVGQMHIYSDFFSYKGGIYELTTDLGFMGGHAIKIIGWGFSEEFNVYYWICQNSWGETWGENGTFRIQMGQCMIDDTAYSCDPMLEQ